MVGHVLQIAALLFQPGLGFLQFTDLGAQMALAAHRAGNILDLDQTVAGAVLRVQRAHQDELVDRLARTVGGRGEQGKGRLIESVGNQAGAAVMKRLPHRLMNAGSGDGGPQRRDRLAHRRFFGDARMGGEPAIPDDDPFPAVDHQQAAGAVVDDQVPKPGGSDGVIGGHGASIAVGIQEVPDGGPERLNGLDILHEQHMAADMLGV
jgi:hypothetical protein